VAALVVAPTPASPAAGDAVQRSGISGGAGFDTCSAPSLSNMQAWYRVAPYRDVGIYIGGENRACSQENLTSSWIDAVVATGYGLIPIWVGLQAPCSTLNVDKMSEDPITAHAQGKTAADDAMAAAQALGLQRGSIVYDDMESYGATPGPCEDAVDAFVDGWAAQLKTDGYFSGVYGSTCGSGVSDWASSAHVPSDVWGANWNGENTVWNLSCVDNALWNGRRDRRVHQFNGSVTRTFNGVTMNVDEDCENGQVAGARHADDGDEEHESLGGEVEDPSCVYWTDGARPAPPAEARGLVALTRSYPDGFGLLSTTFVDERHGWATIEPPHSSNFGMSDLYRTSDGGAHWESLGRQPFDGPVVFTTKSTGWAGGAAGNGRLFVTTDAGRTWREQFLPAPAGTATAPRTVGLPVWIDPRHGAVTTWVSTGRGGRVVVVATMDGGRNWTAGPPLDLPALSRDGRGTVLPLQILAPNRWEVSAGGATWVGSPNGWRMGSGLAA
jgi:hypothetical protein